MDFHKISIQFGVAWHPFLCAFTVRTGTPFSGVSVQPFFPNFVPVFDLFWGPVGVGRGCFRSDGSTRRPLLSPFSLRTGTLFSGVPVRHFFWFYLWHRAAGRSAEKPPKSSRGAQKHFSVHFRRLLPVDFSP